MKDLLIFLTGALFGAVFTLLVYADYVRSEAAHACVEKGGTYFQKRCMKMEELK